MTRGNAIKGVVGCTAVLTWMLLFAAGLLIDSKPYRDRINGQSAVAIASATGTDGVVAGAPSALVARTGPLDWQAFAATMLTYTPLNALASRPHGRIHRRMRKQHHLQWTSHTPVIARRSSGTTAPVPHRESARIDAESFVIYLGVVAGIYITSNSPFATPTADQYVRLVGTLSLLAFVVGYDPTQKFQDFLNLVPRPGGGK